MGWWWWILRTKTSNPCYLGPSILIWSSWYISGILIRWWALVFPFSCSCCNWKSFHGEGSYDIRGFRCQVWNGNPLRTIYFNTWVAKLSVIMWQEICLVWKLWSNFCTRAKQYGIWVYFNGIVARYSGISTSCPVRNSHLTYWQSSQVLYRKKPECESKCSFIYSQTSK